MDGGSPGLAQSSCSQQYRPDRSPRPAPLPTIRQLSSCLTVTKAVSPKMLHMTGVSLAMIVVTMLMIKDVLRCTREI